MAGMVAQVSLYMIRQPRQTPAIEEALRIFQGYGLEVQLGSMSTVVSGEDKDVFEALKEAFGHSAARGDTVMVITLSNACPLPVRDS